MKIGRLKSGELVRISNSNADILRWDGGLRELLAAGRVPAELEDGDTLDIEGLRLASPVDPGKIVAIGLNYRDHCREAEVEPPAEPVIFAKFPSSVIGPDAEIVVDRDVTNSVDWEGELGVVIGRRLRHASREQALEGVFGYTAVNDVSARDLQPSDGQWIRAKSLDTFCPVGPWIVTADEIPDPQALRIWTDV